MSYTAALPTSTTSFHYLRHAPTPAYAPALRPLPTKMQVAYKCQLRARLAQCHLADIPMGFPFSAACAHASLRDMANFSCEAYEFHEELLDGARAAIRFAPPQPGCKYYSWRAFVPTHGDGFRTTAKYASAEVRLHSGVLGGSYGRQIMRNAVIILRALAVSLELGMLLTIRVADTAMLKLRRNANASDVRHGDVVFIGTDNLGHKEIVFNASAGDL
ncbi:hypothetical protein HDZ31DRAFT_43518 [Schizophyllum fasciatum]